MAFTRGIPHLTPGVTLLCLFRRQGFRRLELLGRKILRSDTCQAVKASTGRIMGVEMALRVREAPSRLDAPARSAAAFEPFFFFFFCL